MATLPLPSINMLSPHFMNPSCSGTGLPPLSSPLSSNAFARILDAREQTQQQSLASVVAAALSGGPVSPELHSMSATSFTKLPALGLQTFQHDKIPNGPCVGSPSLEPLTQVAMCAINDEMDSLSNAVLSANPVTPPPEAPASLSGAASIDALLSGDDSNSAPSFQPVGAMGSPARSESTIRLPSMHSPSREGSCSSMSVLCEAAHQKSELSFKIQDPSQSRRRGGARGDLGPQMNQSRYWTEAEHQRFLQAVRTFGAHNHKAIASFVATRSSAQVRSHSQKFFKKLETFRGQGLPSMTRKRKTLKDISMHQ